MSDQKSAAPTLEQIIQDTLQLTDHVAYKLEDYEKNLRFAIAWMAGNGQFQPDFDEMSRLLNLYCLLWKLKAYFKA